MASKVMADAPKLRMDDGPIRRPRDKVIKRFPGFERPLYGRDSLFLAQRLRQDYWRRHKERADLLVYRENIAQNQKRADYVNEVRRVEGFLQNNLTHAARVAHLTDARDVLKARLKELGVAGLPEYS